MTQLSTRLSANIIVSSGKVWRWQLGLIKSLEVLGLVHVCDILSNDSVNLYSTKSITLLHKCDATIFRTPLDAFDIVDADLMLGHQSSLSDASSNTDILINFSEHKVESRLYDYCQLGMIETRFSTVGGQNSQKLAIAEYLDELKQAYIAIAFTDVKGVTQLLSESRPSLDKGSLSRNLNQYFQLIDSAWKRTLKKVLSERQLVQSSNDESAPVPVSPSTANIFPVTDIPKLYQRFGSHVAGKLLQKYKQSEQWILLLKFISEKSTDQMPLYFSDYIELIPPSDVFWADPFVVTEKGRHFVFFEELPFETEQGHLCCMEVFKDGSYSKPQVILKLPYHLSFPNVFNYKSNYYMIPETGDNGAIELYQCIDFPYQWEKRHTLIEGLHAYDSTLLEHDGRWWLFATVAAKKGMSGNEELHIFYADSPTSTEWKVHNANPVISDASTARPAGQFFKVGEDWFRPSQDCAGHYGAGLNINKIIQLDVDEYKEQQVHISRPDWKDDLIALHTLNFNNDIAVADALRVTPKGVF